MISGMLPKLFVISLLIGVLGVIDASSSMYSRRRTPSERVMSIIRPRMFQNPEFRMSQTIQKSIQLNPNRALPCCKDESGGSICKNLRRTDLKLFTQNFFVGTANSTNCFDRMSAAYCSRFETGDDAWNNRRWSCDTSHFRLGFRVCRSTCGFCGLDWINAPEALKCF
uniref:ShKT domain-containing protein n=1 Tax=Caenorhabditis tropicalis TaxID=1561998 RepID=A0A1I7TJV1_9PELO